MLGKLSVPGRPTYLDTVGQGPIAVGVGGAVLDIFCSRLSFLSSVPSLWESADIKRNSVSVGR